MRILLALALAACACGHPPTTARRDTLAITQARAETLTPPVRDSVEKERTGELQLKLPSELPATEEPRTFQPPPPPSLQ
jgi:hypothetical protein